MRRIGIIGAGTMGRWHAQRWAALIRRGAPAQLAGFFDMDVTTAESAAAQYGGRAFASQDALFADVDTVIVTTPTPTHRDVVVAAAARGKDIFCEKPMARHQKDCRDMIAACAASGSRLFVGQVVRFFPEFARAHEVLARGDIGQPGVIRTTRGGSHPKTGRNWYANYEQSGGVILDLAIHDLDYVRWCCGDVERVYAQGLMHAGLPQTDYALISLRFKSGAVGHVEASWAYPPGKFITRLEIAGVSGLIEFNSERMTPLQVWAQAEAQGQGPSVTIPESPLAEEDDPYYREDKHFLDCLISGEPFMIQPEDGMAAVEVALAAIHSLRTGKPVPLDSFEEVLP